MFLNRAFEGHEDVFDSSEYIQKQMRVEQTGMVSHARATSKIELSKHLITTNAIGVQEISILEPEKKAVFR
ncbi:hypothetical protein KF728_24175 [Candidatus Obscuribacterales bacterium]|nr:hypothetical protein [Candidatus Obscuribacterales bacterium]MBX3153278.1 hypothetical protein [Candidatus Obscuribacterales bacterium]